ncbi:MAG: hypothetical protein ACRC7N_14305 [Clostridium sp.]
MGNNFYNWDCYKTGGSEENPNNCRFFDSDILGGFQDINPELFLTMANLMGIVMADNMPFNVQNAVGNWLSLLGQTILTYNAQQQYFQTGPGRYYNPKNRNVGNPFCPSSGGSGSSDSSNDGELLKRIKELEREIDKLKKEYGEKC